MEKTFNFFFLGAQVVLGLFLNTFTIRKRLLNLRHHKRRTDRYTKKWGSITLERLLVR